MCYFLSFSGKGASHGNQIVWKGDSLYEILSSVCLNMKIILWCRLLIFKSSWLKANLKATSKNAADDILVFFFSEKIRWHFMWIGCQQPIHIKCQVLFSLRVHVLKAKISMSSSEFVIITLRVKVKSMEHYCRSFQVGFLSGDTRWRWSREAEWSVPLKIKCQNS